MKQRQVMLAAVAAAAAAVVAPQAATAFPDQPISVVVCTPAGGGNDRTIRAVEQVAQKHFGQPISVRYREGAGGTLAMQDMVAAKPTGYELTFCDNGGAILAPIAQGLDLGPHNVVPIGQLAFIPWVFTVRTDSGYQTMEQFVEAAKKAKEGGQPLQAPITSIAGADHYSWLLFARESGIGVNNLRWTPFGGGGPKLRALIAGETKTDMMLPSLVKDHVAKGDMKVLAVAGEQRAPEFPDSPTFKERGLNVVDGISIVLYAPPGTPADRVARLRQAVIGLRNDPDLANLYKNLGQDVAHVDSSDKFIASWEAQWKNARAMLKEVAAPR